MKFHGSRHGVEVQCHGDSILVQAARRNRRFACWVWIQQGSKKKIMMTSTIWRQNTESDCLLVCSTQARTVRRWRVLQAGGKSREVNGGSGGSPWTKMHISSRPFQRVLYFPWTSCRCPLFSTFCSKVEKERDKQRRILAATRHQSWCGGVHALSLFATNDSGLLAQQNV